MEQAEKFSFPSPHSHLQAHSAVSWSTEVDLIVIAVCDIDATTGSGYHNTSPLLIIQCGSRCAIMRSQLSVIEASQSVVDLSHDGWTLMSYPVARPGHH